MSDFGTKHGRDSATNLFIWADARESYKLENCDKYIKGEGEGEGEREGEGEEEEERVLAHCLVVTYLSDNNTSPFFHS